ncbi:hypothetical protein [uncultured Rhodospira sp.]|nr:hypothetical protein [uncultured Rhodospira sp.]
MHINPKVLIIGSALAMIGLHACPHVSRSEPAPIAPITAEARPPAQ